MIAAALFAIVASIASPDAAAEAPVPPTVKGLVTLDGKPLPGVSVAITCNGRTSNAVTNEEGEYGVAVASSRRCTLHLTLEDFQPVLRDITVRDGENDAGTDEMKLTAVPETITLACGPRCSEEPAVHVWDDPLCSEYALNDALITAWSEQHEPSAVALLTTRWRQTVSGMERHRIAAALLGTAVDAEAWAELEREAELAVRFPQLADGTPMPEFKEWCEARGLDAYQYRWNLEDALQSAGNDKRSRALLLRALTTDDWELIAIAILALGAQHDETSLPKIDEALQRVVTKERYQNLPAALSAFESDAADALALKYLDAARREDYLAERRRGK